MTRLRIITFISFTLSLLIFLSGKEFTTEEAGSPVPKEWLMNVNPIYTPAEHIRTTDQTFLTYPEWFLVHSPAEQAEYFKQNTSTYFPYLGHIQQIWKSYYIVYKQIKENFPFNTGYHVMILVIGTSTTFEYAVKSFYEKYIGVITNPNSGYLTEEDKFNAAVTQEYVDFIRQTPWYEFDFTSSLKKLYTEIPFLGDSFFRKLERRYYLTTDLGVKAIYGYLIKLATKSAYEDPILSTIVVVPAGKEINNPKIKVLKELEDNKIALALPRYADFNPTINELAKEKIQFKEIAGNNSAILITLLVPTEWNGAQEENYKMIFTQPVITNRQLKRVAIVVPILKLDKVLRKLQKANLTIEHVYDF